MSYYSEVFIDLRVKREKMGKFCKELEKLEGRLEKEWIFHNVQGLVVEEDGRLCYECYLGEHDGTDDFVWWLKDFVKPGRIFYRGEEHDHWGYVFDGRGKVYNLDFSIKRGSELKLARPRKKRNRK